MLHAPHMRTITPFLILMLCLATACAPTTSSATADGDSTATAAVDTATVIVDTAAIADVPPVPTDTADPGKVATPSKPSPATDLKYRLKVSFTSMGGGIDFKAKTKYDAFIIDFGKRNNATLQHETATWGREGEVDYCFNLGQLNPRQQGAFVQESKALLKDNELVDVAENVVCQYLKKQK